MPELVRPLKQGQWGESALRVLRERYLDKGKEVGPDGRIRNGKPYSRKAASNTGFELAMFSVSRGSHRSTKRLFASVMVSGWQ